MKHILIFLSLIVSLSSLAQFNNNQESNTDYKFVENKYARVIYSSGQFQHANYILNNIKSYYPELVEGFSEKPKKVNIILRSNTMISNGFVRLAPFKSEFFSTPYLQGELDSGNWLQTLAIHEFRHIAQYGEQFKSTNQLPYIIGGETFVTALAHWSIPTWAWEGDAVVTETRLTPFGRGRSAAFKRSYAMLAHSDDITFTYDHLFFGSDKYVYPDHYKFGYFFLIFLEEQYGLNSGAIFSESIQKNYNPYAYINVIEDKSKKEIDELVKEFRSYLKKKWPVQKREEIKKIAYRNSYFPNSIGGDIYTLETGPGVVPHISKNQKEIIHYPTNIISNSIRSYKDKIMWIENRSNPRWTAESHNIVCSLNTRNNKSSCEKFTGNELSIDQNEKLYLTSEYQIRSKISLINIENNKREILLTDKKSVFIEPIFLNDSEIAYIKKDATNLFHIYTYNLETKNERKVHSAQTPIRRLSHFDNQLYFESTAYGKEDIFSVSLASQKSSLTQHTNSKYGSINPSVSNGVLHYVDYTKNGFKLISQPFDAAIINSFGKRAHLLPKNLKNIAIQDNKSKEKDFSDDYFNTHSWLIIPPLLTPNYLLSIQSNNITETLSLSAGLSNNTNESTNSALGYLSLQKFFFHFDLGFSYGDRSSSIDDFKSTWKELKFYAGPKLLLNHNWGRWNSSFTSSLFFNHFKVENKDKLYAGELVNGDFPGHIASISYSLYSTKESLRRSYPYSLTLSTTRQENFNNSKAIGFQEYHYFSGGLPLPFFGNLSLSYQKERQEQDAYEYQMMTNPARGFTRSFSSDIEVSKLDLSFPVAYPNYSLWGFFYFKRFDLGAFYDYMNEENPELSYKEEINTSYGLELITNVVLTRTFPLALDIGVRSFYKNSRIVEQSGSYFEIFLASGVQF